MLFSIRFIVNSLYLWSFSNNLGTALSARLKSLSNRAVHIENWRLSFCFTELITDRTFRAFLGVFVMVGLALVLLALRARNILICQLDSVVSYSARSRRCSNCMHAQKSLAFFVCGLCRSHFVISYIFFFHFLWRHCDVGVRCFLVFQEHGMKFLRVFKLNVGTLYLADGKNQVAYFEILRSSRSISSFSPSRIPQHNNKKSHISFAKNSWFLSAFYAFASLFFLVCRICVCKVGNFSLFFFSPSLLWELLADFSLLA